MIFCEKKKRMRKKTKEIMNLSNRIQQKCSIAIQNSSFCYPIYHFDDESHEQRKKMTFSVSKGTFSKRHLIGVENKKGECFLSQRRHRKAMQCQIATIH